MTFVYTNSIVHVYISDYNHIRIDVNDTISIIILITISSNKVFI